MLRILKLKKLLSLYNEIQSDKGVLTVNGELKEGIEVFIYDEAGEPMVAPDGEYIIDGSTVIVADGKVAEIKSVEVKPEPKIEEPIKTDIEQIIAEKDAAIATAVAEKEQAIAEKETLTAEYEAKIAELEAKIKELEDKAMQSVETPIDELDTPKQPTFMEKVKQRMK